MKFKLYLFFFISIILLIIISIFIYKGSLRENLVNNNIIYSDLSKTIKIIEIQNPYPMPGGNLVYISKTGLILKNPAKYEIVNGWLCGKQFIKIGIDYQDPYNKKCYKYALTSDKKHYQIGAVIKNNNNFQSIITGNTDKNLLIDYQENIFVQNNSTKNFPYNPQTKYLGANFGELQLDNNNGSLKVLDNKGKVSNITLENYIYYQLIPNDTIILKGTGSKVTIKFENQDLLYLTGNSIIKIKDNEISMDNSKISIFWLIGNIVYNAYSNENSTNIQSNSFNISVRGDIFQGLAQLKDNLYQIKFQTGINNKILSNPNEINSKVKKYKNIQQLFELGNNYQADIFGTQSNINIENYIEIE